MADFDYTTVADIKVDLKTPTGATYPSDNDTALGNMISEASRLIDRYKRLEDGSYKTGDHASDETRYYFGSGSRRQVIDPATSITTVSVEETDGTYTAWAANTDFFYWPYNYSTLGEPIRALEVNTKSGTTKSVFTFGPQRVKVVGKFGISSSVPADIARACKIQVQRWLKRAQQGWADSGANRELGALTYVRELDPDVKLLLDNAFPHRTSGV